MRKTKTSENNKTHAISGMSFETVYTLASLLRASREILLGELRISSNLGSTVAVLSGIYWSVRKAVRIQWCSTDREKNWTKCALMDLEISSGTITSLYARLANPPAVNGRVKRQCGSILYCFGEDGQYSTDAAAVHKLEVRTRRRHLM